MDAWIPRDDPLWRADVSAAAEWVGSVVDGARWPDSASDGFDVHTGRASPGRLGELVCFAGRGPGEVFHGGRKVVGLSQWRAREGALFSSCAYLRWEPAPLLELMHVDAAAAGGMTRDLMPVAVGLGELDPAVADLGRRARAAARLVPRLRRRRRRSRPVRRHASVAPLLSVASRHFPSRLLLVSLLVCPRPFDRRGAGGRPVSMDSACENGPRPPERFRRRERRAVRGSPRGVCALAGDVGAAGGCIWVAREPEWLCSGGKGRRVVRSGVRGRQRTQARERRGRHSWWQASSGGTSTRSTRRAG